ncbi:hypothetical protein [Vibrio sonorensis]|nr:hypothetical protein [Vibrio sonorensis]
MLMLARMALYQAVNISTVKVDIVNLVNERFSISRLRQREY